MKLMLCWGLVLSSAAQGLTAQEHAAAGRLVRAYPTFLATVDSDTLVWKDGTRTPLKHATAPNYAALLEAPGLLDELATIYPTCQALKVPSQNDDPGRIRYEPLFSKMYGGTPAQVQSHLENVLWFGQTLRITRISGVAASLRAVQADLLKRPELWRYTRPSAGAYFWRTIAGTSRLSLHAYGAAIDLNTHFSNYWRWSGYREGQAGVRYRNQMPLELVSIFEKHGWIWGGRWYHFDTLHFEYRPELTSAAACL